MSALEDLASDERSLAVVAAIVGPPTFFQISSERID
jgi:hypothetical protein